jgi:hypothetical protein
MGAAAVLRVSDCRARVLVPQSPEWQRIGNQIDAAMISREKISTAINKAYELTTPSTTLARNA